MVVRWLFCASLFLVPFTKSQPGLMIMSMSANSTMQSRIIGHWQLVDHYAFLRENEDDHEYPLGSDPKGVIIFTQDGYMSTHMVTSDQGKPSEIGDREPSYTDPAFIGSRSTSYAGSYSVDTTKTSSILSVQVQYASVSAMIGSVQQREMRIDEDTHGTTLSLNLVQPMRYIGQDRLVRVRWRKASSSKHAGALLAE